MRQFKYSWRCLDSGVATTIEDEEQLDVAVRLVVALRKNDHVAETQNEASNKKPLSPFPQLFSSTAM